MPDGKLEISSPKTDNRFTLSMLQTGMPDSRGRLVRDVLVAMSDFKVYRTRLGISVCFSDDAAKAAVQKDIYFRMTGIAEFNLLINNLTSRLHRWRDWFGGNRHGQSSAASESREAEMDRQNANRSASLTLYERQLSRCISQALLGQEKEAEASLSYLRQQLCARIRNRARVVHLAINVILTSLLIAAAYLFASAEYRSVFGFGSTTELGLSIMMGSIGALFSTTVRLHLMEIDPTVTPAMHWVYGAQRVIVGALGALAIYFGFKSGVLNGLFQPIAAAPTLAPEMNVYWLSFVCLLAGFSERLVPNLLDSRAEQATRKAAGKPKGAEQEAS